MASLVPLSEKEFQAQVVELAKLKGWKVYHTYDSRRSEPGFPDLVLVKWGKRIIYAELKTQKGKVNTAQLNWLCALKGADGNHEVHVWRPSDWDTIVEVLS